MLLPQMSTFQYLPKFRFFFLLILKFIKLNFKSAVDFVQFFFFIYLFILFIYLFFFIVFFKIFSMHANVCYSYIKENFASFAKMLCHRNTVLFNLKICKVLQYSEHFQTNTQHQGKKLCELQVSTV